MSEQFTAAELLSHSNVVQALRRAYLESDVGGDNPIEQGGFILYDPTSARLEVVRLPAGGRDTLAFPICADGAYQGKQIVGSFHTHPNTGPDWRQEPGRQDIRLSQDYPETMGRHQFVIAREKIYHIDNDGAVSELGLTAQLLDFDDESV